MCCTGRRSAGLLRGEKLSKPRVEVKRAARTQHGSKNAKPECSTRAHGILHSSFFFCVPCDLQPVTYDSVYVCFCSPPSWCADGWFKREVSLQMRAFNAIYTAVKPPAAQALNPARPDHPTHLPVDTLDSVCSCHSQHWPHATFSMGTVLQGLGRCHRPWLRTLSTRQAQGTSMRRAGALGLRCSSCSSRGPRSARATRGAFSRPRAAIRGPDSGP